ncbi:MAG: hypothetical protein PHY34_05130 [Patescibacteria group bacterium]|nr:hypothetical protein [Patescibacteria group bacterium]MDD5715765.1 hypothetical protein [Patescibacteria group bacterium]
MTTMAWQMELRHDRIGTLYSVSPYGTYTIFRETVSQLPRTQDASAVLVFGFRLKLIGSNPFFHWLFQRVCILTTPFWSGFRGFRVKLWMVDPKTKDYLGIYEWSGEQNARVYINFLTPILKFFSTRGSIWHYLYPDTQFEKFLAAHRC